MFYICDNLKQSALFGMNFLRDNGCNIAKRPLGPVPLRLRIVLLQVRLGRPLSVDVPRGTVTVLKGRIEVFSIPSSSDQWLKERKHVTAALVANGYPKCFAIDVGKPKRPSQQLSTTAPDAARGFCILPYIKGTTEPIKRILSNYNIKVAQKPHQTIRNLFRKPKD